MIKLVAAAIAVVLLWTLPTGWGHVAAVIVAIATVAFLTYSVVHPSSQFFVPVLNRLPTNDPVVALTFDDGPDPIVTSQVLDALGAHGARATFFVLGERAAQYPELIRRMHREGHAVGTHTHQHRIWFHFASPSYVKREIEDAVNVVSSILPRSPKLFRPPQGLRTPFFADGWLLTRGLTCVTWSVRGLDSRATTADAIVARIEQHLAPGAIVTLHDGTGLGGGTDRGPTIAALHTILGACASRGLRCVTLDEHSAPSLAGEVATS